MKYEQTICYKVTNTIDRLELSLQTRRVNPIDLVKNLHEIREQAQKMEDGLRARKKLMIENKLEESYQAQKSNSLIHKGINEIAMEKEQITKAQEEFEVVIKRKGIIVYENIAYAGVLSMVERVGDIDDDGTITGITQKLIFGMPILMHFAFDQLSQSVEARLLEITESIKQGSLNKKFTDPEVKRQILEGANIIKDNYGK